MFENISGHEKKMNMIINFVCQRHGKKWCRTIVNYYYNSEHKTFFIFVQWLLKLKPIIKSNSAESILPFNKSYKNINSATFLLDSHKVNPSWEICKL